jgi:hypothetical protein
LINGAMPTSQASFPSFSSSKAKKLTTTIVPNASLNLKPTIASSQRQIPKAKILQMQFWNMAKMASQFSSTFNIHDVFLANKTDINHERNPKYRIKLTM